MSKLTKKRLEYLYNTKGLSLREIGGKCGISHEWVRLLMRDWGIETRQRGKSGYSRLSIQAYIDSGGNRSSEMRKILNPSCCSVCGNERNLHIHHKSYPAKTTYDIVALCSSCHRYLHNAGKYFGLEHSKRLEIYSAYEGGVATADLAITYGISRIYIYKIINQIRNNWRTVRAPTSIQGLRF